MTRLSQQARMNEAAVAVIGRASCLIERGRACVAGFERLGKSFSADTTRQMVNALECGAPAALYDHWLGEQEKRLAAAEARRG